MSGSILKLQSLKDLSTEEERQKVNFSTISWVNCNGWGASTLSADNCH